MQTNKAGMVSLNPACVTIKTPLARKAREMNSQNPLSKKKLIALSLVSATLVFQYSMQFFYQYVLLQKVIMINRFTKLRVKYLIVILKPQNSVKDSPQNA